MHVRHIRHVISQLCMLHSSYACYIWQHGTQSSVSCVVHEMQRLASHQPVTCSTVDATPTTSNPAAHYVTTLASFIIIIMMPHMGRSSLTSTPCKSSTAAYETCTTRGPFSCAGVFCGRLQTSSNPSATSNKQTNYRPWPLQVHT